MSRKVVHIIEATATGTLAMASLLANAQVSRGHNVFVIYSMRAETPKDFCAQFDCRITLIHVQMTGLTGKILSIKLIRAALMSLAPDVVIMHSSFAGFLGRIACIGTLKSARFFYLPHCISFMRKDIGKLKRQAFILFEWVGSLKRSEYVACSRSEQKAIQAAVPFRTCHLVENALDFDVCANLPHLGLEHRERTVVTIGQIRPQKGPEIFAQIARMVNLNDPTIKFVWVGDGDQISRNALESAGVQVIGWVPKNQVWQYLQNARLYLSTALWEGMPVSVIEATFTETPIVASNCAGNADVVLHDKTGWLFNAPEEACKYILSSFMNPQCSQSMAKDASNIARQRFTIERYFREIEALIKS